MHYNLGRYYAPFVGSYLSVDPRWLDTLDIHPYGYARADPFGRQDPLGDIAPLIIAIGGAALVGGVISAGVTAWQGGSWRQIGGSFAHGALSGAGAAAGLLLGGLPGLVAGSVLGGGLGSLAEQAINGQGLCFGCAAKDALVEGLFAGLLGLAGKLLGPVLGRLGRAIAGSRLGQAISRAASRALAAAKAGIRRVHARMTGLVGKLRPGMSVGGKPITRIRPGNPNKVAIVGRRMKGHVEDAADDLSEQGAKVELFNEAGQKNNVFKIDGEEYSWKQLEDDFGDKSKYKRNSKGWIEDDDLPNTLMYKANKIWVEKLEKEGYTVIDMGYPPSVTSPSVFYDMETGILF